MEFAVYIVLEGYENGERKVFGPFAEIVLTDPPEPFLIADGQQIGIFRQESGAFVHGMDEEHVPIPWRKVRIVPQAPVD